MTIGFGEPFGSAQPVAEMSDSATAPAFSSFEELKATIETEPTIVSTALLIQAVQSRLQRPSPFMTMSDAEIEKSCEDVTAMAHPDLQITKKQLLEQVHGEREQHAYLKRALARLEGRLADAASTVNREDWQTRLRRLVPDDPVSSPVEPLPDAIEALFSDASAFEREHAPQVGGNSAEPMRTVLGVVLGSLIENYGVDPRNLADYVRETLRFVHPEAFK